MLRLTRTAVGLLTAQYKSVLKKCWAINVGVFGLMGKAATSVSKGVADTIGGTLSDGALNVMAYMLGLLDSLLNIKSNAFDEQSAKAPATELPFGAPTVAGTLTAFGANVMDGLSEKRVFKTKLITSTAIGLMVATTILPSDAEAGAGIAVEGEIDGYYESTIYSYYYTKYTRGNARSNYLDVQTTYSETGANGPYFDLETFLVDLSEGRLFVSGAITTHDIKTGAVTSTEIADGAVTDAKIASGITASKIAQNASYRFVSDTDKATWNGKQAALTQAQLNAANSGITAAKVSTYDGYAATIAGKQNALSTAQLAAANSGITAAKVSTYDGYAATIAGKQNALSTAQLAAANSGITAAKVSTYDGYATTIAGKADKATTLAGYGITDAYTKTQVDNLISGSGSGSSYNAGTGISIENKVISLDSTYLNNNYYRKEDLGGGQVIDFTRYFKSGKFGENARFLNDKSTTFDAERAENVSAAELRRKIVNETSKKFAKMPHNSPAGEGTLSAFHRKAESVMDNLSKCRIANDNFIKDATTFLRAI